MEDQTPVTGGAGNEVSPVTPVDPVSPITPPEQPKSSKMKYIISAVAVLVVGVAAYFLASGGLFKGFIGASSKFNAYIEEDIEAFYTDSEVVMTAKKPFYIWFDDAAYGKVELLSSDELKAGGDAVDGKKESEEKSESTLAEMKEVMNKLGDAIRTENNLEAVKAVQGEIVNLAGVAEQKLAEASAAYEKAIAEFESSAKGTPEHEEDRAVRIAARKEFEKNKEEVEAIKLLLEEANKIVAEYEAGLSGDDVKEKEEAEAGKDEPTKEEIEKARQEEEAAKAEADKAEAAKTEADEAQADEAQAQQNLEAASAALRSAQNAYAIALTNLKAEGKSDDEALIAAAKEAEAKLNDAQEAYNKAKKEASETGTVESDKTEADKDEPTKEEIEKARQDAEAAKAEADKLAAEEAAKTEADKLAAEEAAKAEADKLAAEEAEKARAEESAKIKEQLEEQAAQTSAAPEGAKLAFEKFAASLSGDSVDSVTAARDEVVEQANIAQQKVETATTDLKVAEGEVAQAEQDLKADGNANDEMFITALRDAEIKVAAAKEALAVAQKEAEAASILAENAKKMAEAYIARFGSQKTASLPASFVNVAFRSYISVDAFHANTSKLPAVPDYAIKVEVGQKVKVTTTSKPGVNVLHARDAKRSVQWDFDVVEKGAHVEEDEKVSEKEGEKHVEEPAEADKTDKATKEQEAAQAAAEQAKVLLNKAMEAAKEADEAKIVFERAVEALKNDPDNEKLENELSVAKQAYLDAQRAARETEDAASEAMGKAEAMGAITSASGEGGEKSTSEEIDLNKEEVQKAAEDAKALILKSEEAYKKADDAKSAYEETARALKKSPHDKKLMAAHKAAQRDYLEALKAADKSADAAKAAAEKAAVLAKLLAEKVRAEEEEGAESAGADAASAEATAVTANVAAEKAQQLADEAKQAAVEAKKAAEENPEDKRAQEAAVEAQKAAEEAQASADRAREFADQAKEAANKAMEAAEESQASADEGDTEAEKDAAKDAAKALDDAKDAREEADDAKDETEGSSDEAEAAATEAGTGEGGTKETEKDAAAEETKKVENAEAAEQVAVALESKIKEAKDKLEDAQVAFERAAEAVRENPGDKKLAAEAGAAKEAYLAAQKEYDDVETRAREARAEADALRKIAAESAETESAEETTSAEEVALTTEEVDKAAKKAEDLVAEAEAANNRANEAWNKLREISDALDKDPKNKELMSSEKEASDAYVNAKREAESAFEVAKKAVAEAQALAKILEEQVNAQVLKDAQAAEAAAAQAQVEAAAAKESAASAEQERVDAADDADLAKDEAEKNPDDPNAQAAADEAARVADEAARAADEAARAADEAARAAGEAARAAEAGDVAAANVALADGQDAQEAAVEAANQAEGAANEAAVAVVQSSGGGGGGSVGYSKTVPKKSKTDKLVSVTETTTVPFSDVSVSSKNFKAIVWAKANEIVGGYADGTFKPGTPVNRVEMLKILLESTDVDIEKYSSNNPKFTDVQKDHWYWKYVKAANALGIFQGDNGKLTARPADTINRVEALKLAFELPQIKEKYTAKTVDLSKYTDIVKNAWYAKYASAAVDLKLFDLVGTNFNPNKNMTRGEITEMLYRIDLALGIKE